jgi:hypothetical protein
MIDSGPRERFKTFPPRWSHIYVPTSSRSASLAALALYGPCRAAGRLAHWAAWHAVLLGGATLIPGRSQRWVPPVGPDEWRALEGRWRTHVGPYDTIAVYEQPQATREGCALLPIRDGRAVAFIKLRTTGEDGLSREGRALTLVAGSSVDTFWTPEHIASGSSETVDWLAMSPLPRGRHRPARQPPLPDLIADVQGALAGVPRPRDVPATWRPMHGDLTPWNLRVARDGRLLLIDWEDAGWGPPGADATYFWAAAAALWGTAPPEVDREAAAFWRRRIAHSTRDGADSRLRQRLDRTLETMGG